MLGVYDVNSLSIYSHLSRYFLYVHVQSLSLVLCIAHEEGEQCFDKLRTSRNDADYYSNIGRFPLSLVQRHPDEPGSEVRLSFTRRTLTSWLLRALLAHIANLRRCHIRHIVASPRHHCSPPFTAAEKWTIYSFFSAVSWSSRHHRTTKTERIEGREA